MPLQDTLAADLKTALLGGNMTAATTLRMLKSEIKNAEIATGKPLSDEEILQVIRKEAKKRNEAFESFSSSGKDDLAAKEKEEFTLLSAYLPAQVDRAEVEAFITELHSSNPDFQKGDLIRQTLAHFSGRTDGKTVSEIVSTLV